jgi:hypothetical protein
MKYFKSWIERPYAVLTSQLPFTEETTLKRNGDVLLSIMLLGSESAFAKPTTLAPKEGTITKPKGTFQAQKCSLSLKSIAE